MAIGDADVCAERQHLIFGEPFTDVVLAGLQLRRALDDALKRLAADEVPAARLRHQAFAFPLFRGAGSFSPDVLSGSAARLPEPPTFSKKPLNKSIGIGKIVVELFSDAISLTVWR